jgi:hypothetical protein
MERKIKEILVGGAGLFGAAKRIAVERDGTPSSSFSWNPPQEIIETENGYRQGDTDYTKSAVLSVTYY